MTLTAKEIREKFLSFFQQQGHKIVPAAPIVNKNDSTLMFINSGMAQFKDFFLGNQNPTAPRIADTQKCLRVSGKHNDLEDVGMDGTHHTMFEMLGNWSFGDYFKKEAIEWSWTLLTEVYQIPKDKIYATVFEGDARENLPADDEALQIWLQFLPKERILYGNKKDNFWEMGDTGPCGPCSEIHVDMRSDAERAAVPGRELVNVDGSGVVEIWNNVFMEFERLWNPDKGGSAALLEWDKNYEGSRDSSDYKKARTNKHIETTKLKELSAKHVDTGMGFERLCMVLQGKTATYDTDIFRPLIAFTEGVSGIEYKASYEKTAKSDIAMRVLADHVRAVALIIADGQMPSNTGAGYVLRRILRRAVRYYYSFLNIHEPFIYRLLPLVADMFDGVFPEVKSQQAFISNVILSEEETFLRTLSVGLKRLEKIEISNNTLNGNDAFELFDTYGFPFDLTKLIAAEKGWEVDEKGFNAALLAQKERSKKDAQKEAGNWVELIPNFTDFQFVGYDEFETLSQVVKYRYIKAKGKEEFEIVLNKTPFYAESGGQVGDTGSLLIGNEQIAVVNTRKENNLIIHQVATLPTDFDSVVKAAIDKERRDKIIANHSATHLLHAALRQVLGTHVQQKGSLVAPDYLRFDFSHLQKVSDAELLAVERIVNQKIRENIALREQRNVSIEEAKQSGATMLFGEKYGETVRVITFGEEYSKELCGGCHVSRTGDIGLFKITSEGSTQSGVRRVEAITGFKAEEFVQAQEAKLSQIAALFKNPLDLLKAVQDLQDNYKSAQKDIEKAQLQQAAWLKTDLIKNVQTVQNLPLIAAKIDLQSREAIKHLCSEIHQTLPNAVILLANEEAGKANLTAAIEKQIVDNHKITATELIKFIAADIQGGGGGSATLATAGGKNPAGIESALTKAATWLADKLKN